MSHRREIERVLRLLDAEPRDVRLLRRAAQLMQQDGDHDGAAGMLARIALGYAEDGYAFKAISLLKQVLKLRAKATLARALLAELYRSVGLGAEAITEYSILLNTYRFEGDADRAAHVLGRLAELGSSPLLS
jgi:hypothetical protein